MNGKIHFLNIWNLKNEKFLQHNSRIVLACPSRKNTAFIRKSKQAKPAPARYKPKAKRL